ncbi:MAG: ATP-binding protein [Bacteroidia bacterium]
MKDLFKNLWFLLFAGVLVFSTLIRLEQRQVTDDKKQLAIAYAGIQQIINDKEIAFVKMNGYLLADTSRLQRNWNNIIEFAEKENIIVHVYRNDTLLIWSSNEISTQSCLSEFKTGTSFWQSVNGNYIVHRKNAGSYTFVFLYLINSDFAFKNQYIANRFNEELSFIRAGFVHPGHALRFTDINDLTGNFLFSIQVISASESTGPLLITGLLFSLFFVLLMVHIIARKYIHRKFWLTTFVFFGVFTLVRWLNILEHVPAFLYENKLFDPSIYASSQWFPSLGDLLIDSVIALWYLIILENRFGKRSIDRSDRQFSYFGFSLSFIFCLLSSYTAFYFIKSLAIDSQISFNIGNVSSINQFTYFGIFTAVFLLMSVYFICRNFIRLASVNVNQNLPVKITALLVLAGVYFFIIQKFAEPEFFLVLIAFALMTVFFIFRIVVRKLNRFQQYFVVVFIISVLVSIAVTHWVTVKEHENRKLFSGKFATQNDITTEYFLRTIEKRIADDNNITDYFLYFFVKSKFEKRIKQLYFTGYLSKFEVSIFDYDTLGYDLKQKNSFSYSQINKIYLKQSLETIDSYFRYISGSSALKGYLAKFTVRKNDNRAGYLFILLQPKLIQDENRFDELLIEGFRQNKKKLFDYSYGVYKDKHLIFQSGNYPYRITNTWGEAKDTFRFFTESNFEHLLYTDNQPVTIVVSKPADTFIQGVALFSFIFTFCTLILIFILFFYTGINQQFFSRYKIFSILFFKRIREFLNHLMLIEDPDILYIRTRIQTSIIFIVFVTLAATAYFTVTFINQKYNARQTERLMKKIRDVIITVENENIPEMEDPKGGDLEAFINQIADVYDTDITLFDPKGTVRASSIGKIFDEGIVSGLMNPQAFYHLNFLKESQYSQDEHIASLGFQAAYAPVFTKKSELLGYIQLPYFSQKSDLLNEISSVIVGFINLYVLLFIIIGIIAYLVSRNISYPLMLIQQKLSSTILGGRNEPISWSRDDEIGELVKQYNSMIVQLDESAKKLAETEREGTWREIARQIAHEIKNPLTPMKLSIQHLQRAFKNNDPNIEEKINRTTGLLITQIDTLSELATEFSSYAQMPSPVYESLNLKKELNNIIELFKVNEEIEITLNGSETTGINFDRSYLNRSIGNLVKNAIQSIPEGKKGKIDLGFSEHNENVVISVNDNGCGMTAEESEKIFIPYFSTKVSGMGLGLPLVKTMIETCGGKIDFTTKIDEGTKFIISLPKNST